MPPGTTGAAPNGYASRGGAFPFSGRPAPGTIFRCKNVRLRLRAGHIWPGGTLHGAGMRKRAAERGQCSRGRPPLPVPAPLFVAANPPGFAAGRYASTMPASTMYGSTGGAPYNAGRPQGPHPRPCVGIHYGRHAIWVVRPTDMGTTCRSPKYRYTGDAPQEPRRPHHTHGLGRQRQYPSPWPPCTMRVGCRAVHTCMC